MSLCNKEKCEDIGSTGDNFKKLLDTPVGNSTLDIETFLTDPTTTEVCYLKEFFPSKLDERFKEAQPERLASEVNFEVQRNSNFLLKNKFKRSNAQKSYRKSPMLHKNLSSCRLFFKAIEEKKFFKVKHLLQDGVSPNICDSKRRSALHVAVVSGSYEIVKLLLVFGCNPNHTDYIGNTALHLASITGNINVITLLLQFGASPMLKDQNNWLPIHYARSRMRYLSKVQADQNNFIEIFELLQVYAEKIGNGARTDEISGLAESLSSLSTEELPDVLANFSRLSFGESVDEDGNKRAPGIPITEKEL